MIFSRKYDKSLWLMSLGNKRNMIVDFIDRLPHVFCEEVQDAIKSYYRYLVENKNISRRDRKQIEIKGKFLAYGDMFYWYSIDSVTGALNIGEGIIYEGEEYNTIWMTINPFKSEYYNTLSTLDVCLLGDMSYNFIEDYVDDELQVIHMDNMEFNLIRLPFGKSAVCSSIMESIVKKNGEIVVVEKDKYDLVNMNRAPNTYDVGMIGKKYTRTRKKVNSK